MHNETKQGQLQKLAAQIKRDPRKRSVKKA